MTDLALLHRLVGAWQTEATHPALPGVVVKGAVTCEWLEGERFLIQRSRAQHPDFPDSVSIIGVTERDRVGRNSDAAPAVTAEHLTMHYFDSRGVFRVYRVNIDYGALRVSRVAPGFSQRFTGTFADGGKTIYGKWQVCEDDVHWQDDLEIVYRQNS
jgi:hypothetical protein